MWCGGSAQSCVSLYSSCPGTTSYYCSVTSPSSCSAYGGTSCSSSSSSYYYYSLGGDGSDSAAKASVSAGVAVSLIIALLLVPLLLCQTCERTAAAPHMGAWEAPAQRAHRCLSAAYTFYTLGMVTAYAAPAIPWLYLNGASMTGLTITSWGYTYINFLLFGGSVSIYLGLVFVLCAWVMTLLVAIRLRTFLRARLYPATFSACCSANMVAIEGLAWTGFIYVLAGAVANWALINIWAKYLFVAALPPSGTPGSSLLYFSVASLLLGTILLSCASCQVTGMPGVGRSRTNCCCPETRALQVYAMPVGGGMGMPGGGGMAMPVAMPVGGGMAVHAPAPWAPAGQLLPMPVTHHLQINTPKVVYPAIGQVHNV